jgi:hypothetical protein
LRERAGPQVDLETIGTLLLVPSTLGRITKIPEAFEEG